MRRWLFAVTLIATSGIIGVEAGEGMRHTRLSFSDLNGWATDDHSEALQTFVTTCKLIKQPGWDRACQLALTTRDARDFFEGNFVPVLTQNDQAPLFTGYFEPELNGSRVRQGPYQYPLYKLPPEAPRGKPWLTRAEIEGQNKLAGRGLELAWLADPVEAFFLHVQGSGRLRLPDGSTMRVGFAGKNGHRYRSVGKELARKGLLPPNKVSAGAIKSWVRKNPEQGRRALWHNPSFIFFHEIDGLPDTTGPIGAMSRPVTALRSIAVDPDFTPLGAPVWIEKGGARPLSRLMVAQDTGSAIKGAQRADVFYGSGKAAGEQAGRIRDGGRMIVLYPKAAVPGGL